MRARLCLLGVFAVVPPAGTAEPPAKLTPYFKTPAEFAGDFGAYRSPLKFDDGTPVHTPEDWRKRRAEILTYWHAQMGEWHTESEVVEVEDGRRWVWRVGPADEPFAHWGFEVDSDGDGALVRQWAKVGTGRSALADFIDRHPDREAAILEHRMSVWRDGMTANLAVLKQLAD